MDRDSFIEEVADDILLKELKEATDAYMWINENYLSLQEDFEEEYVAIKDNEVIAHGPELESLKEIIERDTNILIEYFPPRKTQMLL